MIAIKKSCISPLSLTLLLLRLVLLLLPPVLCGFATLSCTSVGQLGENRPNLFQITKIHGFINAINFDCTEYAMGFSREFSAHKWTDMWFVFCFVPRISAAGFDTSAPSPIQYRMRSKFNATRFSFRSLTTISIEPTCSITWSLGSRNFCGKNREEIKDFVKAFVKATESQLIYLKNVLD